MAKETFIIYKSFYQPLKSLTDNQMGRLFKAIFEYQINGTEPVDADILMAFEFFKNQFTVDDEKYQKICERNKRNVQKRWSTKNTSGTSGIRPYPVDTKNTYNDNDNENDTDNENGNDIDNELLLTTTKTNICNYIEQNFGRTLAPVEYDTVDKWLSLSFEEKDKEKIIKYAVENAVMQGKKTFGYVTGTLNNWIGENKKTYSEIIDNNLKKQERKPVTDLFDWDWLDEEDEEEEKNS